MKHHAYLVHGEVIAEAPILDVYKKQTADTEHLQLERLLIDDVRALILRAEQRPFVEEKRTFVICVREIALEAQHALLKLFEEPPSHAQFILVVPGTAFLLATLRSRLFALEGSFGEGRGREDDTFVSFSRAPYAERLSLIAEKVKVKDSLWIEEVMSGFESVAQKTHREALLRAVVEARGYMQTRGASPKMLLESLALLLPQK